MLRPVFASLLICCGSPSTNPFAPDAAPTQIDAKVTGPCPANTLCMKPFLVEPQKPVTAGRLTVVWFQGMHVSGLPSIPTDLGYDVGFTPGQDRYDIPLAQIKPPKTDAVLVCQWENNVCLHDATPNPLGFGLPVVLDDTNGNGKIDPAEITLYGNHGVGMAYLVWSQTAHPPGDETLFKYGSPTYFGDIFTQSVGAGVHAYPLVTTGSFDDKLGPPDTAMTPDLALCPSQGTSCNVAPPRLVGFANP
jgi:hypothetical protein